MTLNNPAHQFDGEHLRIDNPDSHYHHVWHKLCNRWLIAMIYVIVMIALVVTDGASVWTFTVATAKGFAAGAGIVFGWAMLITVANWLTGRDIR